MSKYNLKKLLNGAIEISLTNTDIEDFFDGEINIVKYSDLNNYNNLDSVLGPSKRCILLMQIENLISGHYVCIWYDDDIKLGGNILRYYNSFGYPPDYELRLSKVLVHPTGTSILRYLIDDFIIRHRCKLDINKYKHQENVKGINTCGRWCMIRLRLMNLSNYDFNEFIRSQDILKPDLLVTLMTIMSSEDVEKTLVGY